MRTQGHRQGKVPQRGIGIVQKSDIVFHEQWVDSQSFEMSLVKGAPPHGADITDVVFEMPIGCRIMVDTGIRMLSLANQLRCVHKHVTLDFKGDIDGSYGYLNRIGFFDHLDPSIEVLPAKPLLSNASLYRGNNSRLVEIEKINPDHKDQTLPSRLADALDEAVRHRSDHESLSFAAYTVLSELTDNIFQHSSTKLDGYAVLQVYKRGVKVAVSDSGKGIIETLRPSLQSEFPRLRKMTDAELIVEAFKTGLSRHGRGRGCGLKRSAQQAIKYNATLDVRLPTCRVFLEPCNDGYTPTKAYCYDNLPLVWGTHICFDFRLDNAW